MADFYIYNSLTHKKEKFEPIDPPNVTMYTCGPTVYFYSHIGHMRKYAGDDVLKRILIFNGFAVKHVMNITDVGHLTSDADEGEDKLEKGARLSGKTVWDVAKFYEKQFFDSTDQLNIGRPDVVAKATDHIADQIDLIKKLEANGFTYQTQEGVYFDVSKFKNYTALSGQSLKQKKVAVREGVQTDPAKKHPADFALWLFTIGRFANHTMHWPSPWGEGFPGWHIECSAMSMKYLGETIDIHTGGIDHIPVHHTNEIAQSEGATRKQFVKYWVHHNFLMVDKQKMSKSLGNLYTLDDVKERGFDPLALRYLFLTAHYRDPLNFTWKSLESSQNTLAKLRTQVRQLKTTSRDQLSEEKMQKVKKYQDDFLAAINDDINTPQALATLWATMKSNIPSRDKYDLVMSFDEVFGLGLKDVSVTKVEIPAKVQKLAEDREELRQTGDFSEADKVREEIEKLGFSVEDSAHGPKIKKVS